MAELSVSQSPRKRHIPPASGFQQVLSWSRGRGLFYKLKTIDVNMRVHKLEKQNLTRFTNVEGRRAKSCRNVNEGIQIHHLLAQEHYLPCAPNINLGCLLQTLVKSHIGSSMKHNFHFIDEICFIANWNSQIEFLQISTDQDNLREWISFLFQELGENLEGRNMLRI